MAEGDESRIQLHETRPDPEQSEREIREGVEKLLARKPTTLILIIEAGDKLGCFCVGSPRDLIPLYNAGSELVIAQLTKALSAENG